MKVYVTDCRNQSLDRRLSAANDNSVSVNLVLPEPAQPLPNELKLALQTYLIDTVPNQAEIEILVEVNQWINPQQAVILIRHTHKLISDFFRQKQAFQPLYTLAIFEQDQLTPVATNH